MSAQRAQAQPPRRTKPEPRPEPQHSESAEHAHWLYAIKKGVRALYETNRATDTLEVGEAKISIEDVAEDFYKARHQVHYFKDRNLPQLVALFRQQSVIDPGTDEHVPVLIEAVVTPIGDLTHPLGRLGGIPHLHRTDAAHAKEALIDRTSEFLFSGREAPPSGLNVTEVHTRREGDPVLYAKGFFLSTKTVLGTSTPARGYLPPGRYSFGIVYQGRPRFEDFLWAIPTYDRVKVELP
jgi:hypothetical protein